MLTSQGLSDKQIAVCLNLSPLTIKEYQKELRIQLGAVSRTHMVALAYQAGLLPLE